jgi:hypothetical protein
MPELDPIIQKIGTQYDSVGMMAFLGDLGAVSGVALVAAASVALVVGGSVEAVKTTMDWGESLKDVTLKLGGTTEQAAGYKLMSDAAGMSVDDFTRSLDLMGKNLELVNGKEGNAAKEMDNLHITYRNADGTFLDSTVIFQNVADKLSLMQDGQEKTRIEMDIFGRSGASMGLLLENAANGGMQKYIDQAKAMGLALSPTQVDNIKNLSESMNTLKDQATGIAVIFGSAMIPAVQGVVSWIGNLVTSITPAIAQFGQFLGILLGVKDAAPAATAAAAGTAGNSNPWTSMGKDVKGFAKGDLYSQETGDGGYNYSIGKPVDVVVTNAAAISAGVNGLSGNRFNQDDPLKETPFEQSITSFVDGIKTYWPPFVTSVSAFTTGIGKVDWGKVGGDFNQAAGWLNNVVNWMNHTANGTEAVSQSGRTGMTAGLPAQTLSSITGGNLNADLHGMWDSLLKGNIWGDPAALTAGAQTTITNTDSTKTRTLLNDIAVKNTADSAALMKKLESWKTDQVASNNNVAIAIGKLPNQLASAIQRNK